MGEGLPTDDALAQHHHRFPNGAVGADTATQS
jgi:hypothetical protein